VSEIEVRQIIGPAVDIYEGQISPSLSIDSGLAQPVQFPLWPSFEHLSSLVFASIIRISLLQFRLDVCPRALPIAACVLQFAAGTYSNRGGNANELGGSAYILVIFDPFTLTLVTSVRPDTNDSTAQSKLRCSWTLICLFPSAGAIFSATSISTGFPALNGADCVRESRSSPWLFHVQLTFFSGMHLTGFRVTSVSCHVGWSNADEWIFTSAQSRIPFLISRVFSVSQSVFIFQRGRSTGHLKRSLILLQAMFALQASEVTSAVTNRRSLGTRAVMLVPSHPRRLLIVFSGSQL
jgi:hypothetical protein